MSELDRSKLDHIIEKGRDARVEMYSAFAAPFSNPVMASSGLAEILKEASVTHVFVVGLAFDYCVKATAIDAAKEGFVTYVVQEGTRAVDPSQDAREAVQRAFDSHSVRLVGVDGPEVEEVKNQTT